jgi:ubiquinone/menaquinone biosynthesis C-methylase UbiE
VKPPIPAATACAVVERVSADSKSSPIWAEHRIRYRFAAAFVDGRSVIDVACGDGWGRLMLMEAGASSVLGVDASDAAVNAARSRLVPGFRVERAGATELPVADRSLDVVVSFETLEYLARPRRFLSELRRILKDDGILLLSTPNAAHTRPLDGVPHNPFHVREYTAGELAAMLGEQFGRIELRGQRVHSRFRLCP